jgi:pimeloyl-ACP methyl ester carboxylesterase
VTGAGPRPAGDSLERLFVDAVAAGKIDESHQLVGALAALRPTITRLEQVTDLPATVRLAVPGGAPKLICVPAPTANAGPHQYARLAAHFRGERAVSVLSLLGFAAEEPLPDNPEVAVEAIAQSALRAADGEPFVLVGHSSGGSLGYAAAGVLEHEHGIRPAGVILLDTLSFQHNADEGVDYAGMMRLNFSGGEQASPVRLTVVRLAAMGRWMPLLNRLEVRHTSAPVLSIRCTREIVAGSVTDHTPIVPGATVQPIDADHLSLVREDSARTAGIMRSWLADLGQALPEVLARG